MKMCYHPWVGLDVTPQGKFKPCCKYLGYIATSLPDYQSSQELADLRQSFLNGEQPEACSRCWHDEAAGIQSKRLLDNEYVFKNVQPSLDGIKVLSMPFGNTCNLACMTCSSLASSKWGSEAKKYKHNLPDIPILPHVKYYQDPTFVEHITSLLDDVIHIDIPGGEPFFANKKIHLDFLSKIKSPENVSIHYTTNGTVRPSKEIAKIWDKFKKVDIQISIDGIGNKNEYIRWPSEWNTISNTLDYYKSLRTQKANIVLSISTTVSVFNVMDIPNIIEWLEINELPYPYMGLVTAPTQYNISILPQHVKNSITKIISDTNDSRLLPIIQAMNSKDNSFEVDKFMNHVKILDTHRNQSFVETFPELYQLLGEQCQTLYQQY